jgi:glycosyltransferase 2 family protein
MGKKHLTFYGAVLAVLGVLIYLQFRTWRDFDWATFWGQTDQVHMTHILCAIALTYMAYVMRAIRWKLFLQPVRPQTSVLALLQPTVVGFTGLALLGRPGELIRPYLIARRTSLPFSSQLAVWTVERIFDVGAFTVLLVVAIFFAAGPKQLAYYANFREAGFLLIGLVVALTLGALAVSQRGEVLADWVERRFAHLSANLGQKVALRIREFRGGLNTIHSASSLLQLIAVSVGMWYSIALAYQQVTYSYDVQVLHLPVSETLLLMGSSMVGSMVQLPGVGGGSQLATIATLQHVFGVPHELAASCGILLWLVTFVSVVPVGLLLAHRERLSLRKLSEESHRQEDAPVVPSAPPAA